MKQTRYGWPTGWLAVLYVLFLNSIAHAQSQILFYSQAPSIAKENIQFEKEWESPYRKMLPLNGNFELRQIESGSFISNVRVPSAYHQKTPFIFRRRFPKQPDTDSHYRLCFLGINGFAEISVNHYVIYRNSRNFLPAKIPIPDLILQDSTNLLEVKLFPWNAQPNQLPMWLPVNLPRIDNGITGSVYLEILPEIYIGDLRIFAQNLQDSTEMRGNITIRSNTVFAGNYQLEFNVLSDSGSMNQGQFQFTGDSTKKVLNLPFAMKFPQLQPWSPQSPQSYRLKMVLRRENKILDQQVRGFSVRTVTANRDRILLNEEPLSIQGINYVYQNSEGNMLFNKKLVLEDLEKIKSEGFNAVRILFYPQSPLFYRLTDSLGLICFQDLPFPLLSEQALQDSLLRTQVFEYVADFLEIAREHPSVAGLGLSNFQEDIDLENNRYLALLKNRISENNRNIFYISSPFSEMLSENSNTPVLFELLERNHQEQELEELQQNLSSSRPVLFSAASKAISYRVDSSAITHDLHQITELYVRLQNQDWLQRLAGNFILTYSDYYLQTPALQAGPLHNFILNTAGVYKLDRSLKKEAASVLGKRRLNMPIPEMESEKKQFGTFLFILFGLMDFLLFMLFYRSFIDFRQNVHRSIRKPHGFFTDLQERLLIPYGESFFLMLVLAVNGAVILGSILYFFRNNLYMDYALSLVVPNETLKLWASSIIWKPVLLVPVLTILIGCTMIALAIPVRFISFFRDVNLHTRQAVAIGAWAATPFLIILPLGMFFYNLLLVLNSYWILFVILLYFHVWYLIRWMNGARVMLELRYSRVFLYSLLIFLVLTGGFYYLLSRNVNIAEHIRFLFLLIKSTI